jgi:hypothetical protein
MNVETQLDERGDAMHCVSTLQNIFYAAIYPYPFRS